VVFCQRKRFHPEFADFALFTDMHVQRLITIEAKEKESKSIRQLFDRWHDADIFITERIWINSSNSFAFLVSWYFTDFFGEVHEQRQNKK
jgi:hypothetical protein